MYSWPLEGTVEGSEPTIREPAWESDTHTQLTQAQAWVVCPQVVQDPCQALWPAGALRKKYPMPPPPILTPSLKTVHPSPSHVAASLDRGRGSGQKGKCEFPSACHQSPQALRVVALGPTAAMEPLETPVKDGILYQQHVKFGKVGTCCQAAA